MRQSRIHASGSRRRRAVALLLLAAGWAPSAATAPDPPPEMRKKIQEFYDTVYAREYGKLIDRYVTDLVAAGKEALSSRFPEQARLARQRLERHAPGRATELELPADLPQTNSAEAEAAKVKALVNRLQRVENDHANRLMRFAESCYQNGLVSRAYELMFEVLQHNPDHQAARLNTGFVKFKDQWVSKFDVPKIRQGMENHDRFGWLPKAFIPKYEAGQRFLDGRWVTLDQERAVRSAWEKAWEIETPHYKIRTNKGLEEGVEFGRRAEELYDVFFRAFIGYFNPQKHAEILFKVDDRPPDQKHLIYYFATREDYEAEAKAKHGGGMFGGKLPIGYYTTADRACHFYYTGKFDLSTLYHEGAHQLFAESRTDVGGFGGRDGGGGYWVVEGIACYLETCRRQEDGRFTLGDPRNGRIRHAIRLVQEGKQEPLRKLMAMNQDAFMQGDALAHYDQSTAVVLFLMHGREARYREDFVRLIDQVYRGKGGSLDALAACLGVPGDQIEKEWIEYMKAL